MKNLTWLLVWQKLSLISLLCLLLSANKNNCLYLWSVSGRYFVISWFQWFWSFSVIKPHNWIPSETGMSGTLSQLAGRTHLMSSASYTCASFLTLPRVFMFHFFMILLSAERFWTLKGPSNKQKNASGQVKIKAICPSEKLTFPSQKYKVFAPLCVRGLWFNYGQVTN